MLHFSKPLLFKLGHLLESFGWLVKTDRWALPQSLRTGPRIFISKKYQLMLLLLLWGPQGVKFYLR